VVHPKSKRITKIIPSRLTLCGFVAGVTWQGTFRAKVKHDKPNTDWLRLVRLYGSIPFTDLDP
jgi:hypothetical protein